MSKRKIAVLTNSSVVRIKLLEMGNKCLTSSFAKVYILKYVTSEKTIKGELFTPFLLSEKMLQRISAGAGRGRRGSLSMVDRDSGFTPALLGFLSA